MGCCMARQAPAKEQCPCPNTKDTGDGQNSPLALALAKALSGDDGAASRSRFTHCQSGLSRSLIEPSLQAKHIRIDT